jgi:hypothetical protein
VERVALVGAAQELVRARADVDAGDGAGHLVLVLDG